MSWVLSLGEKPLPVLAGGPTLGFAEYFTERVQLPVCRAESWSWLSHLRPALLCLDSAVLLPSAAHLICSQE